ncbi:MULTISPECIES: hypothetical protein [Streptomyces]|uniref:hypothetical protein n=1 Tax=Streptomyces TaxID=1883 RepID=UPI001F03C2A7|nr:MULTISPECIES: hypothetical protein [Streptomyces]
MRTRMAATAVVAATVLTLTGSTVASASGKDTPRRSKDSPVKMAACALGSALGALTGGDDTCLRDRVKEAREAQRREAMAREDRGERRRSGTARAEEDRMDGLGREEGMSRGELLPRM